MFTRRGTPIITIKSNPNNPPVVDWLGLDNYLGEPCIGHVLQSLEKIITFGILTFECKKLRYPTELYSFLYIGS